MSTQLEQNGNVTNFDQDITEKKIFKMKLAQMRILKTISFFCKCLCLAYFVIMLLYLFPENMTCLD